MPAENYMMEEGKPYLNLALKKVSDGSVCNLSDYARDGSTVVLDFYTTWSVAPLAR